MIRWVVDDLVGVLCVVRLCWGVGGVGDFLFLSLFGLLYGRCSCEVVWCVRGPCRLVCEWRNVTSSDGCKCVVDPDLWTSETPDGHAYGKTSKWDPSK